MDRLRIYHKSSSAHAGDRSNLLILNNGGKAENEQDGDDAAWAQSIKVFREVS